MKPEPTLAELYFEQFRKEFFFTNVYVEGNTMTYRYMSKTVLEGSAEHAKKIIETNKFPLTVEVDKERPAGSMPFLLKIIYNDKSNG
jgi:hypothetical protein